MTTPNVRVVVRLPYNRPETNVDDPPRVPQIEWNTEKADILWQVIARSRASDSGGADWKGLASHLEVPLPYLLYRAQTRYEEDLRGLQDIRGALSPPASNKSDEVSFTDRQPTLGKGLALGNNMAESTMKLVTPLGVRARLNSMSKHAPPRPRRYSTASTLTGQVSSRPLNTILSTAPSSSEEDGGSSDEDALKEEENDKRLEEQENLDKKLKELQRMMTNEALGLVSSTRHLKGNATEHGRTSTATTSSSSGVTSPSKSFQQHQHTHTITNVPAGFARVNSSSRSTSQSVSSASSPHGSVRDAPSPRGGGPRSGRPQIPKHWSELAPSPPVVSLDTARVRPRSNLKSVLGERESSYASETSSFSDLSVSDSSLSGMESAFMSNMRSAGGSRLSSALAQGRTSSRRGGMPF